MKSNPYALRSSQLTVHSSQFTVHSLKDSALLAMEKAYKKGQFPLSPSFGKGGFRGIFHHGPIQIPLISPFSKWGCGTAQGLQFEKLRASVPLKLFIGSVSGKRPGGITSKELNNICCYSRSFCHCHAEARKRRGILFERFLAVTRNESMDGFSGSF